MYQTHFGLNDKPFKPGWDPKYLWLGSKAREILTALAQGVLRGDGLQVVTGDEGTGKTTLANALLKEFGEGVIAAVVPCPEYEGIDFFKLMAKACGISGAPTNRDSLFDRLSEFLRSTGSMGKKVVLIIDDAHRMTQPRLHVLSELSGLEENGTRLLHLVFFGESPLEGILAQEPNRGFAQNITFRDVLKPLTREETAQYILHRLKVAQCERELFTPGAIDEIFLYSNGLPGLVNKACDAALSRSFYINETAIQPGTIRSFLKLMPEERGAPSRAAAESRADPVETGKRAGVAEEAQPVPPEARREIWKRVTYASLGCFVAVAVGFTLYVMTGSEQPAPAKPEPAKAAVSPPDSPGTPQGAPVTAKAAASPPDSPGTPQGAPVSDSAAGVRPSSRRQQPSGATGTVGAPEKGGTQAVRAKRRPPADPASAPAPGETVTRAAPTRGSAGEPEPDKVIDWLIKRRAEKQ
jgi:type II secretory pathway predicted ATPase ExeA